MQLNEQVKQEVDSTYRSLAKIAKEITSQYTKEIDLLIKELENIENLSDGRVRNIMLQLSLLAYHLGEVKEHSNIRADISTALYKEKLASEFNSLEGPVGVKTNQATVNSIDQQAVQILYTNISKMFTTKLDETHRVVNTLNNVLIGRMATNKHALQDRNEL